MEIKLQPEEIDKFIKEALLKSALGKNIELTIDKAMKDAIDGYNSPVKEMVKQVISQLIKEHLEKEENKKFITDVIVKRITPETIDNILDYGIKKLHEYLN